MGDYLLPGGSVLAGVVLLMIGGDQLVKHAVHLAISYRVPKTVVGALVLGFGTSLPELFVSLTDVFSEDPGIAIGNVVGSNLANVGLILGLGALLTPFLLEKRITRNDLPLGTLGSLFLLVYVTDVGAVDRIAGALLLAGFLVYLVGSFRHTRRSRQLEAFEDGPLDKHPWADMAWVLGGLVTIAVGAHLLVRGAETIARLAGVSELLIGLSVVAVGTSLPELATLLAAARRREGDLAVGNVSGSNIFNLFFVLATAALARPIRVEPILTERDLPALAFFSVLAFPLFSRRRRLGRIHGALLLACYAAFWVLRA